MDVPPLSASDAVFEEELQRNPYGIKTWVAYVESKPAGAARLTLYERGVGHLPGSFKLWASYLTEALKLVRPLRVDDPRLEAVNVLFERALVFMHKMPTIWLLFTEHLAAQRFITRTRRAFDRALQALPVTQHERLWPRYLAFAKACGCEETCVRVHRRYLMLSPGDRRDFVAYLKERGAWDEAALQLTALLGGASASGAASHALWLELCEIVSAHPREVASVPVEPLLRSGIARFSDEVGRLWCALAEHFIRLGEFERARDVFEEAVGTVRTVRDFASVFDAYVQFEEALLTARLAAGGDGGGAASGGGGGGGGGSGGCAGEVRSAADLDDLAALHIDEADDTELRVARLELLMDRRPLLLSSVLLRQNPHNVHEWHSRAKLFKTAGVGAKVVATYAEAVRTVDPAKATGKLASLWVAFARFYEEAGDAGGARTVFKQATGAAFRALDDLALVWCEWAEMEIRLKEYGAALKIMREATREREVGARRGVGGGVGGDAGSVSAADAPGGLLPRLRHSPRVWGLYLDLEESLGTLDTLRAAFEMALSIRVATPAMVLNFAAYCEERGFFEEAFRAFERGVAAFPWPHVGELWLAYTGKFVERYGGSKLERARDLFEQALRDAPAEKCGPLFLGYAALEEKFGLARHAMAVYDRAATAVAEPQRYTMYLAYIRKAEEFFGAPRTREIYQRAIEALPDAQVADMCLRFAELETKLGELDRARAIFSHAANFCDPRKAVVFWNRWQEWETAHGNEESFTDMLRAKRALAASFATSFSGVQDILEKEKEGGAAKRARHGDAGAAAPPAAAAAAAAAAAVSSSGGGGGGQSQLSGALARFQRAAEQQQQP